MFKHVYPHWHKAAQRCLFIIAAILCITLPVAYGKHHISSATLGSVLGIFFGFWLAFSLIVRFCVPSPEFESSLPVYTHSPIPTPVTFHSPARSDAVPSAPAIRLHPPSGGGGGGGASVTPTESAVVVTKGARFAQDPVVDKHNEGLSPPSRGVTFQTRPRGNTADSTNSTAYPTFAAYRQAQHGNFEAMAQRVKRAFALSQQQQQQREEEELKRQQLEQELQQEKEKEKEAQELQVRPIHSRTPSSTSTLRGSALSLPAPTAASGTRSRSASAASMIGDFAERIKNGSFFKRSSSANVVPTVASLASSSGSAGEGVTENNNTGGNVHLRITTEQDVLATTDRIESPSGIAVVVTPSEDDHPHADGVTIARTPTTAQPVNMAHTTITVPPDAPARPGFSRSSTRESSPLVASCSD
ncbi:hypothetical protein BGX34_003406 [Mortierella sp. NVP85]|nr:hypothetical protein BGX34_003406 [Mortierella sp. NVP85]